MQETRWQSPKVVKTTNALKIPHLGYKYILKRQQYQENWQLKRSCSRQFSQVVFKIILTFSKELNLLFHINIMEVKENNQVVSWTGRWLINSLSFPNFIKHSPQLWGKSAECLWSRWILKSSVSPVEYSEYWHKQIPSDKCDLSVCNILAYLRSPSHSHHKHVERI